MIDYAILLDQDGTKHATNGALVMTVRNDGRTNLFKRRAVRWVAPVAQQVCWLVGEIDGVRCYVQHAPDGRVQLVMTRQNLYP